MIATEQLPVIEPEPSVQNEALYSRTLGSGEVVTANSAEEAFAKCPELSRIALSNPVMANMLLELSSRGKKIMEAEQSTTNEPAKAAETEHKQEQQTKPVTNKQAEVPVPVIESAPKVSEVILQPQEEPTSDIPQHIIADKIIQSQATAELAKPATTYSTVAKENIDQARKQFEREAEQATFPSIVTQVETVATNLPTEVTAISSKPIETATTSRKLVEEPTLDILLPAPIVVSSASELFVEEPQNTEIITAFDVLDETATFDPELTTVETHFASPETAQYTTETIETYTQLLLLEAVEAPENTTEVDFIDSTIESAEAQPGTYPVIFDFVDIDSVSEQVESGETINPLAELQPKNEQPLEHTLAQLTYIFAEKFEESEQTEIHTTLADIEAIVARSFSREVAENKPTPLSAELTNTILKLLGQIGYEQPGETLLTFVHSYDFDTLLQTLHYLHQLQNPENRQEFIAAQAARKLLASEDTRTRVGKLLFALIHSVPRAQLTSY